VDLGISGRAFLVVGANGGVGRAVCAALVREGAGSLALGVRDQEAGASLAQELRSLSADVGLAVIACDLEVTDEAASVVPAATAAIGPLDGVVMAAGDPPSGTLWDVDDQAWDRVLRTMLLGPIRVIRAVLPGMAERGWGRVVVVAGLNGRKPAAGGVIAGVVCAGLANVVTAVAKEVIASGVTVNVVDPHFTDTPRWQRHVQRVSAQAGVSTEDAAKQLLRDVPRGRPVPADDVANAIVFLLSEQAASISGAALPIDGAVNPGIY